MDRLVGQDGSVGDGLGTEAVVAASLLGTLRRLRCLGGRAKRGRRRWLPWWPLVCGGDAVDGGC